MSGGVHPAAPAQWRLTTGHQTRDIWAGVLPLALAALAFRAAWLFGGSPGVAWFLGAIGAGLVLLGLVILGLRVHVTNHRDYYGGLALLGLALLAYWSGSDLAGMRGFSFGAGTAPRLFAGGLAVVAMIVALQGLLTVAPSVGGYAIRGPFFITIAVIAFALLIRDHAFEWNGEVIRIPAMGLMIASFVTFVVSAIASKESRPLEAAVSAVALTAFCWFVFIYVLGLPLQLWPRF